MPPAYSIMTAARRLAITFTVEVILLFPRIEASPKITQFEGYHAAADFLFKCR